MRLQDRYKPIAVMIIIICSVLLSHFITLESSKSKALQIYYDVFSFSNVTLQIEPHWTNDTWFTNYYGTNLVIGGTTYNTALIGPTIRLTWENANDCILMSSTNLTDWQDVRVRFVGDTGLWYSYPFDKRFYKLRSAE